MKNLKIKAARAAKDWSQQQLAEAVGVSRQTINAIEKGDYNPTIRLCLAICHALGCGPCERSLHRLHVVYQGCGRQLRRPAP